jgi:hypothetical protein
VKDALHAERLRLFGVRHHGPGCAASLRTALDVFDPAEVLIEGPPDANAIIVHAGLAGMQPPVALLVYGAEDAALASFFPFAEYSPEWQAIRWALEKGRAVRFIDLPVAMRTPEKTASEVEEGDPHGQPPPEDEQADADHEDQSETLAIDPLSVLSEVDGHRDSETWWTQLVEQATGSLEVFDAIAEAMTAVRAQWEREHESALQERQREAHMRIEISKALAASDVRIAVVCGAWHVPALAAAKKTVAKADRDLLKGLEKTKTEATWVAWTDSRLAAASGYRAGMLSPGWYRHLWHYHQVGGEPTNAIALASRWQSRVASLLREEGLSASSASVIEASRLALSLAAMRGLSLPGLYEMQDASLSVICHGDEILLRLIQRKLVIGDRLGTIDESIPQTPLAEDLARWQKKLRLRPTEVEEPISLDLRTETGLHKSELFNRLNLIDVRWAREARANSSRGSFRENWILAWDPQFSIALAEAVRYGTTIESAAANRVLAEMAQSNPPMSMARCSALIGQCLNANLPEAVEALTRQMQALSVTTQDITSMLDAMPPMAEILRYGSARKMPRDALEGLVRVLVAEICVGLAFAARGLNDESAQALFASVRRFDGAVPLLEHADHTEAWRMTLRRIEHDEQVMAQLRGFALRRLHDEGKIDIAETVTRLQYSLSASTPPLSAGQWLEGFLCGAAQLLIHDRKLFSLIDAWLMQVPETDFIELLPMFRRAVTLFDASERRQILERAKISEAASPGIDLVAMRDESISPGFARALPLIKTILGMAP